MNYAHTFRPKDGEESTWCMQCGEAATFPTVECSGFAMAEWTRQCITEKWLLMPEVKAGGRDVFGVDSDTCLLDDALLKKLRNENGSLHRSEHEQQSSKQVLALVRQGPEYASAALTALRLLGFA